MAIQRNDAPGSGSGNQYVDALLWGAGWSDGAISITFDRGTFFSLSYGTEMFGYSITDDELAAFDRAFAAYEAVANIDFVVVTEGYSDIVIWTLGDYDLGAGNLGSFEVPDETYFRPYGYFNTEDPTWRELRAGGDGFYTILHELGHALGLAHPHDGGTENDATVFPGVSSDSDTGTHDLNQGIWTLMSYITDWSTVEPSTSAAYGHALTPMALDIAALQYLYGANLDYQTGNDTYALPTANVRGVGWACIWDAGGTDTITAAGSRAGAVIDLRDAPLVGPNAGGYASWSPGIQGGVTIANGALIENAMGSAFRDLITGNSANNRLNGGGGVDTLIGGAGDDIYVTDGRDTITERAREGTDTAQSSVSLRLGAHLENLLLTGGAAINGTGNDAANRITGNRGDNVLNGGAGADILTGGAGKDVFLFNAAPGNRNADVMTDFNVRADTIRLEGSVFTRIGNGAVSVGEFHASKSGNAADLGDRILYDTNSGRLFYDRDGSGSANKVLFAEIDQGLRLTNADFFIV